MFRLCYVSIMWFLQGCMLLLLPILLCKKKYKQSLSARFLLFHNTLPSSITYFDYWFHSCSLGETTSLSPILQALSTRNQNLHILLTTTTHTGYKQALKFKEQFFKDSHIQCLVRYLPFETWLPFWMKPTKTLFVLEAELWHELFYHVHKKGGKVFLLNARISSRSYPKYLRFKNFYRILFGYVNAIFAQSQEDKERLETLGATNITVTGNLKLLNSPQISHRFTPPDRALVILASTHEGEEQLLFEALKPLYQNTTPHHTLMVIPRHEERFEEVWTLIKTYFPQQTIKRRSEHQDFLQADIVLGDTMGEMLEFYAIASVVILCGSFLKIGGHNPLEIAFFNKPLWSGKEIFNQIPLFESIEGYELITAQDLPNKLQHLDQAKPTQIKTIMDKQSFLDLIFKE